MTDTATTAPPTDKTAIREQLEATYAAFRGLVPQITDEKWNAKSGNAAWTCGQLAWHVASGVDFSAGIIENARKGKQTNPPSFLMPLGLKANEIIVRRKSRGATRESVLADYERDQGRLLRLLDDMTEVEFEVVKTNYGQTQTVREMFNVPIEHFAEHAPEIRKAL